MKIDLAVAGQGAVTPAGVGVEALLRNEPTPIEIASIAEPEKTWPVFRVDLKDPAFAKWQREGRLRRASPITFFLVEAAAQALAGSSAEERAQTGIIVAFSAGCLAYSRRFFEGIIRQGQKTASPALFPETVFNSPVSHVASVFGLNGAAYALVGDESAWVAAIKTASIWIKRERVKRVLVLGVEEFDPVALDAYRCARWLGSEKTSHGFTASEGAAGILLQAAVMNDDAVISIAHDGLAYRTKQEVRAAAGQLMAKSPAAQRSYSTAQHTWLGPLEAKNTTDLEVVGNDAHPYLGEAFTASAAWNTIRALHHLDSGPLLLPIWGLNHQLASLELVRRK